MRILILLIFFPLVLLAQKEVLSKNKIFYKNLQNDANYIQLRNKINAEYKNAKPIEWGEFVKGVDEDLITNKKVVALTFDACGGKNGDEYDSELIDYLIRENIPATLFMTGKWIDANYETFTKLSQNSLFEIENHGFNHKPCSVDGESAYGIKGTLTVNAAFDEIEANAEKITYLTGRRPNFFRSSTAFTDEACAKIAGTLGITIISFDVLSGDAVPFTPKEIIAKNIIKNVEPGAIIIMHMNHPKWYGYEALQIVVPQLIKQGYQFVKLEDYKLKGK